MCPHSSGKSQMWVGQNIFSQWLQAQKHSFSTLAGYTLPKKPRMKFSQTNRTISIYLCVLVSWVQKSFCHSKLNSKHHACQEIHLQWPRYGMYEVLNLALPTSIAFFKPVYDNSILEDCQVKTIMVTWILPFHTKTYPNSIWSDYCLQNKFSTTDFSQIPLPLS